MSWFLSFKDRDDEVIASGYPEEFFANPGNASGVVLDVAKIRNDLQQRGGKEQVIYVVQLPQAHWLRSVLSDSVYKIDLSY